MDHKIVRTIRRNVPQTGFVKPETPAQRQAREQAAMASRWTSAIKNTSPNKG